MEFMQVVAVVVLIQDVVVVVDQAVVLLVQIILVQEVMDQLTLVVETILCLTLTQT